MKKIILTLIFCAVVGIANAVERISDTCYKFDGVLVCEAKKLEITVQPQPIIVPPKQEDEPLIVTMTWEHGGQIGTASFYTIKSSSNLTASGERFDENAMTCASMDYPFGTRLKVSNIENGESVIVKVNDRGGFKKYKRIIDLSKGAFAKIADLKLGVIKVKIEVVS